MTDSAARQTDRAKAPVPAGADAVCAFTSADEAARGLTADTSATGPRADCVLCGEPTEYPADRPGSTLCAVCTWQQAQRIACSG